MGLVPCLEGALATWEKAEFRQLPRNEASQWSTFESGPLATRNRAEIRAFAPIWRELVVHFQEWSTSYPEKG